MVIDMEELPRSESLQKRLEALVVLTRKRMAAYAELSEESKCRTQFAFVHDDACSILAHLERKVRDSEASEEEISIEQNFFFVVDPFHWPNHVG